MSAAIRGAAVTDERTRQTIREVHARYGVFVDPHTAVGCAAAKDLVAARGDEQVIVLATAHPAKFMDVVKEATGREPEMPDRLARCLSLPKRAQTMGTSLRELAGFLLERFA
jgi:threonine synthase